jgi:hypothetical protein
MPSYRTRVWNEEEKRENRRLCSKRNSEPGNRSADSSVSSIFLEKSESVDDRDLKKHSSGEVTVPVYEDFDIGDYDQEEDDCGEEIPRASSRSRRERGASSSGNRIDDNDNNTTPGIRTYSYSELVATLGSDSPNINKDLHPTLAQRVRDFRFAQRKRREKQGSQKPWGIFGLYQNLSDIRADIEWSEDGE